MQQKKIKINDCYNCGDQLAIKAILNGDKEQFNSLVVKYQNKIFRIINKYIKDPAESLDLAQEVFIKAYKGIDNFKQQSSFYTWLYKIAINTAKTYVLDKNRYLSSFAFINTENNYNDNDLYSASSYFVCKNYKKINRNLDSSINLDNNVDNIVSNDELKILFFNSMETLPLVLKRTIILREAYDKTYEEIASITKCPIGTVRSRIARAKKALKAKLKLS